jgi:hypothetical protein
MTIFVVELMPKANSNNRHNWGKVWKQLIKKTPLRKK